MKSILWNIFWNTQNNGLIICKSYFKSIILHVNIKYKSYALITQERKQLICNILVVWWFRTLLLEWVICFVIHSFHSKEKNIKFSENFTMGNFSISVLYHLNFASTAKGVRNARVTLSLWISNALGYGILHSLRY